MGSKKTIEAGPHNVTIAEETLSNGSKKYMLWIYNKNNGDAVEYPCEDKQSAFKAFFALLDAWV